MPVLMAGAGRALLADWHQDHVRELLRASLPGGLDSAIADEEQWLADLAHVREFGYVVSAVELDDLPGGITAPVRDHRRLIVAAISMSLTRVPPESRLEEMGKVVAESAQELSAALGYPRP
ncbi:IclR family transcriptional regulator C-terminal domain-containing protein [Nonomuraea ferruginea]